MLRDRPLTEKERAEYQRLFETNTVGNAGPMRRIRTASQAQEWLEHLADARRYITGPLA